MLGNRIAYTQSPGGIRRGLIWQSSNMNGDTDPRNYLFDYSISSGSNSGIAASRYLNSDIYDGNGTPSFWQWVPPKISDSVITCPLYTYRTQWTTDQQGNPVPMIISSEYSRRIEIDAIFDPFEKDLTPAYSNNDQSKPLFQQLYGENTGRYKYYEAMTGQQDYLGKEYGAQMSCPFRIKGVFIYSDYYYDIYTAAGGTYVQLDPEAIFNYFESLLSQESFPLHSDFVGSMARGLTSQMYTLPFPSFILDDNSYTRQLVDGNGNPNINSVLYAWTKSARTLYQGLNSHYCMYISPALYPAYIGTGSSGDAGHYSWNAQNPNSGILQSNVPGFDEIRLRMPYMAGYALPYWDQQFYPMFRSFDYLQNEGFTTPGSSLLLGQNVLSRIPQNAIDGVLRGSGIKDVTPTDNYALEIPLRDVNYQTWLYGQLQPSIGFKQKYLVDVSPSVASFRTSQETYDDIRCGRFKYLGFKGTISFFETQ